MTDGECSLVLFVLFFVFIYAASMMGEWMSMDVLIPLFFCVFVFFVFNLCE
jgi:hypothetical protein